MQNTERSLHTEEILLLCAVMRDTRNRVFHMVQRPNMNHAAKDMPSGLTVILDSAMSTTALVPLTASRRQFIYNRPRPMQQKLWFPLLGSITLNIRLKLFIARLGCHAIWCCTEGRDPGDRLFNLTEHCRSDAAWQAWQHLLHDPQSTVFPCLATSMLLFRCSRPISKCTQFRGLVADACGEKVDARSEQDEPH